MRRTLARVLTIFLAASLVLSAVPPMARAAAPVPQPDVAHYVGLTATNAFRARLGLPAVTGQPALAAAARAHSDYMIAHHLWGHYETPGDPDSTGQAPDDRASHFGYNDWAGEVVVDATFPSTTGNSVQGWIDTLYHRVPFLDPRIAQAGFGDAIGGDGSFQATEEFGALNWDLPWTKPVVYPLDGQTQVPAAWDAVEEPNPLRLFPGTLNSNGDPVGPTGTVITASFFNGDVRNASVSEASLTGSDGSKPDFWTLSPDNDDHLRETVCILPKAPLHPDTTYTAHITGVYRRGWAYTPVPFDVAWSFRTAQAGSVDTSSLGGVSSGTSSSAQWTMTIGGQNLAQASAVYVGGLPYPFEHRPDGSLRLSLGAHFGLIESTSVEVEWPDGSTSTWARYWVSDANTRIVPVTATTTAGVGGAPPQPVGTATDGDFHWLEASPRLLPGAQVEDFSTVHMMQYGSHTLEWDDGNRLAYADGEAKRLPYAPVSTGGVSYLPQDWLTALLGRWNVALTLGGTAVSAATSPAGFSDVAQHWARASIARLATAGIVSGNGDGTFGPDQTLTRAAFVKMLVKARGLAPDPGNTGGFSDTANHWLVQDGFLGAAVTAGIVKPGEYPDGAFNPDDAISRDEIAVMVVRALGLQQAAGADAVATTDGQAVIDGKRFDDAGQWLHPGYVAVAIQQGIVSGYAAANGDYTFRGGHTATRAEAATMIVRMLDKTN